MAKTMDTETPGINIIGSGTQINGDVCANGDFRVDGIIIGNFSTALKLVIGPSGYIEGNIECNDCEIHGRVKGNILTHENMVLRATADVAGDIEINRLSIEPGANFVGHCNMLNVAVSETETEE